MERAESCLKCQSVGLEIPVYSKSGQPLEDKDDYEKYLSDNFCYQCTQKLNIPKERPSSIQKKITQDLLRLSMNIDNIKGQIAQLIYNLTETHKEAQSYRDNIREVEKYKKSELPPSPKLFKGRM